MWLQFSCASVGKQYCSLGFPRTYRRTGKLHSSCQKYSIISAKKIRLCVLYGMENFHYLFLPNLYIIPIIINDAPMYIRTRSEITFSAFSFPLYIFTAIRKIMANIHHSANMHLRIFFFFTSIFLLSFMINNALFYCQIIRS